MGRVQNMVRLLGLVLLAGCLDSSGAWSVSGDSGECEEFSCVWPSEQGSLERISSWNEHEYAYRMVGDPARITRKLDAAAFPVCLEVLLTADVAKDAQLTLQLDFGADGSIDTSKVIEAGKWTKHSFLLRTPANSRHLRLGLNKTGAGEVAVQWVGVQNSWGCLDQPPLKVENGSTCLEDQACASGRCVLGVCSACGAGGCTEGSACREGRDCQSGACAAGVCRACAANASCGEGEGCSAASQCASSSCVFGSRPSLTHYPQLDGVCGECSKGADCASGHCEFGMCAECGTDADCSNGQRCRYDDLSEAKLRRCVPRFDGILPRGALCEEDIECELGLRCAAGVGRAKRCGTSCGSDTDCGGNQVCANAGSVPSSTQLAIFELLPAYAQASGRVSTCYPLLTGAERQMCTVHAQCKVPESYPTQVVNKLSACCYGSCSAFTGVDLETGACTNTDPSFAYFH